MFLIHVSPKRKEPLAQYLPIVFKLPTRYSGSHIKLSASERISHILIFQTIHTDKNLYLLVFFNERLEESLQLTARGSSSGCEIRSRVVLFVQHCLVGYSIPHPASPIPQPPSQGLGEVPHDISEGLGVAVAAVEAQLTSPLDKESS